MAAGLGVGMVAGSGGGDGDVSLAASVTSSALPCTPMLAKTELVTMLAELIAAKDHGQVRSSVKKGMHNSKVSLPDDLAQLLGRA